ncbi:MAG TPA: elongation factor G [Chloroflexi bacterium]|nr:elongation factor G [Chloroflexota bacterium]
MKEYTTESIRNVAIVSHGGAGKTMMTEAFLFHTGATTRMGKVEEGTTVSDFDEEEIRRAISLYTSVIPVEYKNVKVNFLDTPGYTDFVGEVISALRVADSAIVLVDSVAGVEVGTEVAWNYIDEFKLPRFVVINKMDRENANYRKALSSVEEFSTTRLLPVQLPWGEKQSFQGVIDLITMKAYKGEGKTAEEIPAEYKDAADEARLTLVEAAAEGEDELLEKYLESGELTAEEIQRGLCKVIRSGSFIPVFVSAASSGTGIIPLLDAIVNLLPSPVDGRVEVGQTKNGQEEELTPSDSGPLAAYVWKTTADPFVGKQTMFRVFSGTINSDTRVWNSKREVEERLGTIAVPRGKETIPVKTLHAGDIGVVPKLGETVTGDTLTDRNHPLILSVPTYPNALYQVAVFPKTQADSTKISSTLTRLAEEDMTLSWHNEPATLQTILQGMGDQHIDVAIRRAETKFQVGLTIAEPKVPYQETITKKATAMYRHKKQTGGAGQFGEVHLRLEPYPDGEFNYTWEVFGGAISQSYSASIQKGIQGVMREGVLAGFPVRGVHVAITDGKEHPVDSKPIAFEIAGREAFKLAFKDANPVLYEPIMKVQITVPEANMGDVLGDLNTRRARVLGMDTDKGRSVVTAMVPLAEMLRYTTQLRSLTGGRGIFTMEFDSYEIVPPHITAEIVAARQKELQKEE